MSFKYDQIKNTEDIIVKDPIHGEIIVEYPFSKIITSKEMMRLKNITQTGFSKIDYPSMAENERLSHSIGAYHIMKKIIEHLEKKVNQYGIKIAKEDKEIALSAILLHDIGHGPFSHSCEGVTGYSHEKRTRDILLGNTEIKKILEGQFGKKTIKKIASFISEINDEEITKNSFTNLFKSLVSHQIDADRLDYLVRDSYYAKLPTAIDINKIIDSMGVIVNNNQEYEITIDKSALTAIETILIERYQRYRDLYYCKSSKLMDYLFPRILDLYKEHADEYEGIPKHFKELAFNSKNIELETFLEMTDEPFEQAFKILSNNPQNPVLSYLCNYNNINEYEVIQPEISIKKLKKKLKKIFPQLDTKNTLAVFELNSKIRLYKKDEGLKIDYGYTTKDVSESTNLIRPQEILDNTSIILNLEILRLELKMTKEEFSEYREDIKQILSDLNKINEEFELKYIITNEEIKEIEIIREFIKNGFNLIAEDEKQNNDLYYDDNNFTILKQAGSLRIRKTKKEGKIQIKGTYKKALRKSNVYSSRIEIEEKLQTEHIKEFYKLLNDKNIDIRIKLEELKPVLIAKTQRKNMIFERNRNRVCLSFDETEYEKPKQSTRKIKEKMIEIEVIGNVADRIILNDIHEFIEKQLKGKIKPVKQSKFERGIEKFE